MSKIKTSFKAATIFTSALILLFTAVNVQASDNCVSCHKDPGFRVQNKVLFDYFSYWKESVHESSGILCIDCHGGDESMSEKNAAHSTKDFSPLTADDSRSHKRIAVVCGKCHKAIYKNFKASKHYIALQEERNSPNCVTCHGSMNTETYEASNIAAGCTSCHNNRSELAPGVGIQAEDLLTKINFIRAYKKWVTLNYKETEPETVKAANSKYRDVALSWHQFNFNSMNEKTRQLLIDLRGLVNKGVIEKKKENR